MKYYVQVNRHFMVTLSAEHIFLDLDGVQYSNAFDNEGRKTDTFRGALLDCDTISREELEKISEQYAETVKKSDEAKQFVQRVTQDLKRLKKQVEETEAFLVKAQQAAATAEQDLYWAKVGIGLEEMPDQPKESAS